MNHNFPTWKSFPVDHFNLCSRHNMQSQNILFVKDKYERNYDALRDLFS